MLLFTHLNSSKIIYVCACYSRGSTTFIYIDGINLVSAMTKIALCHCTGRLELFREAVRAHLSFRKAARFPRNRTVLLVVSDERTS